MYLLLVFLLAISTAGLFVAGDDQTGATAEVISAFDWKHRCVQDDPLGMISGAITDSQITASSTQSDQAWQGEDENACHSSNARIYKPNGLAWCPKFKTSSEWIQVDLGVPAMITGIMTQGRGDAREWVTSYIVSYSEDATTWRYIMDSYGNQKVFIGNSDSFTVKHNYLDEPVIARFLKLHPYTWNVHPSLRFELVGCQPCKQLLGVPPYARYSASTSRGQRVKRSCTPDNGHYLSNKAWCPTRSSLDQWLQIEVGPPTLITGVIMKGRGDSKWKQYVTKFKLSYSNDSRLWYFYKDTTQSDPRQARWNLPWLSIETELLTPNQQKMFEQRQDLTDMIFDGNSDQVDERIHYLNKPFVARFVRIHPIAWFQRIAMRVGLLGCRHMGRCESGFFKVNDQSSCVANLAYQKSAFVSEPNTPGNRHSKRHLGDQKPFKIGASASQPAQLVVDGIVSESAMLSDQPAQSPALDKPGKLHQCVVLQQRGSFGRNPVLFVDLKERATVNGVILFQAAAGDKATQENLEKLTVYIEDSPRESEGRPGPNSNVCGFVTRNKNVVFNQKLHIPCEEQGLVGRYLYVEASGIRIRYPFGFSAVLCEIMVY